MTTHFRVIRAMALSMALLAPGASIALADSPAGLQAGSAALPILGMPGASPPVGSSGIPLGATELGTGGLSPPPLGAPSGLAPFGSSIGITGTAGLGATGTTMPGIAGSTSSLGLSPGVMPPASTTSGMLMSSPGAYVPPHITNYGFAGMQRPPGSPPGTGLRGLPVR